MKRQGDRGSISLELAILAPALLMLLGLAIFAGRTVIADNAVEEAARAAARSASIAIDQTSASAAAQESAAATLDDQGLNCVTLSVVVDTSGFSAPIGTPSQVSVTVTCTVSMADLGVPGISATSTLTATFFSPIDTYRQRI